ncbi:unnamed protein product, partial [Iphiclides podalirius]
MNYSKDKGSCCKEISQTEGRTVEPWPKTQMWPCNYPPEPQPPNYDPYKIRSPEVVVPPLAPSNAKWTGLVYTTSEEQGAQHGHHHRPNPYDAQSGEKQPQEECPKEEEDSRGFFGTLKNIFGWGKKGGSERDAMIDGATYGDALNSDSAGSEYDRGFDAPSSAIQSLFHKSQIVHPDNWKPKSLDRAQKFDSDPGPEIAPRLGYHGRNKYKYAFHEPWNPLDRLTLLAKAEKDESPQPYTPVCAADKGSA